MFLIKEFKSKDEWQSFLAEVKPHTFLQSWNWGEFQITSGHLIWRLGIYDDSILSAVALIVKIKARRGTFLFCPHGPILSGHIANNTYQKRKEILKIFIKYIKKLAAEEKTGFIRISPLLANTEENRILFKNLGFRQAPIHMHPERAWILDVTKSEEVLLKEMRKQTRHCIRNAEKLDISVVESSNPDDVDTFYAIYRSTVARQDFVPFSREYLKKEFACFTKDKQVSLFLGKYQGEIISGAIVIFANGSGFYHHGASNQKFAKFPSAHLLQWKIVREVKLRGLSCYNFWGIAPENLPHHPWAGLSLFKKGFGGISEEYVAAQDLPLKWSYWMTYVIERIRKMKRGL